MYLKLHLVHWTYFMLVAICCSKQQCGGKKENAIKETKFLPASTSAMKTSEIFGTNTHIKPFPNSKRLRQCALNDEGCVKPDWTRSKLQSLLPKQKEINHVKDTSHVSVKINAHVKEGTQLRFSSVDVPSDSNDNNELAMNKSRKIVALNERSDFQENSQHKKPILKNNNRDTDNGSNNQMSPEIGVEKSETYSSQGIITEVPKATPENGDISMEFFNENIQGDIENGFDDTYQMGSLITETNGSSNTSEEDKLLNSESAVKTTIEIEGNGETANISQINLSKMPSSTEDGSTNMVNHTVDMHNMSQKSDVEEVPIPVFSEWTQKQMEAEANKIEQEQLIGNNSAQKRNNTNGNGKTQQLKIRAKNYAAPDCGAKIVASNSEADHSGAVLSNSRDEYMLNTCGASIWFVVELCEAIQVQRVELANFELFSSSPKNFTVAVSNRVPTREWSNVGHFTAEDKRTVQSFNLYPHLFGKLVRVEIQSHYSTEHFCPISLFRVFGTSEIEAFETETGTSNEVDDFDDEDEGTHAKKTENIFKSASDAVIQIVKKAAEVLVKPTTADSLNKLNDFILCRTPAFELFTCDKCNDTTLVSRINYVLSCELQQIENLLAIEQLRIHLQKTDTCANDYGIFVSEIKLESTVSHMQKNNSYFLNILPFEYIGALCKLLSLDKIQSHLNIFDNSSVPHARNIGNISIQLAPHGVDMKGDSHLEFNSGSVEGTEWQHTVEPSSKQFECTETTAEKYNMTNTSVAAKAQMMVNLRQENQGDAVTNDERFLINAPLSAPDVNIYNVPPVKTAFKMVTDSSLFNEQKSNTEEKVKNNFKVEKVKKAQIEHNQEPPLPPSIANHASVEEPTNWDGIETIITATVSSTTTSTNAPIHIASNVAGGNGINVHQKTSNGAQSESILIRLSNRVKALERNMSLSGQYLEELSRRYKKQVEELQQTLTQHTLTVRALEDQNLRYIEKEHMYLQQNAELGNEVRNLSFQVQFCFTIVIIVSSCTLLLLVLVSVYYRRLYRQIQDLALINAVGRSKPVPILNQNKLNRRKSFEDFSDHQNCVIAKKKRRPSEEAMLILKDYGVTNKLYITKSGPINTGQNNIKRQRKLSVFYDNTNYVNHHEDETAIFLTKRKGSKHSLHALLDNSPGSLDLRKKKYIDEEKFGFAKSIMESQQHHQSKSEDIAFPDFENREIAYDLSHSDFEEKLLLNNDEIDFLPNSDLAYNEFMPDGPSGYQTIDILVNDCKNIDGNKIERRLSSPAYFRSPFGRGKIKIGGKTKKLKTHSGHAATSWEWCRNNFSNENQQKKLDLDQKPRSIISLNSSPLLEINLTKESTDNSFHTLEGTMLLSDNFILNSQDKKGSVDSSSSSSNSSGSTMSNSPKTKKKKHHTFNKIFRNVF